MEGDLNFSVSLVEFGYDPCFKIRGDSRYGPTPSRRDHESGGPYRPPPVEHYLEPIPVKGTHDGCLERVPYASTMAAVTCFIGVILFSVMMAWGFNATVEQTRRCLKIDDWPWVDKVQVFFIVLTVLMSLFAVFFLALGCTATGSTREKMYREGKSRRGGRFALGFAMLWTAGLIICWLLIVGTCGLLVGVYNTFISICSAHTDFTDGDCIDLGVFQPLIRGVSHSDLQMCGGDAQQFCALSDTARTWYIVGFVGSLIVVLGLAMFLAVHAANYAHVGNANRYVELRDLAIDAIPTPPAIPLPKMPRFDGDRWKDDKTWHDGSSSGTRLADRGSDSVSQYNYNKNKRIY